MSAIATLFLNRAKYHLIYSLFICSPACYEILTLLQFLNVNHRVTDVNPMMTGKERKFTKNNEVPIIRYDNSKNVYESDPKKIIRYI